MCKYKRRVSVVRQWTWVQQFSTGLGLTPLSLKWWTCSSITTADPLEALVIEEQVSDHVSSSICCLISLDAVTYQIAA